MKINPLIFRIGLGIGVLLLAIGAPLLERDEHCIVLFSRYKIRERYLQPTINFGRYCNASARCTDCISSLPAKSAMVRESFRMR